MAHVANLGSMHRAGTLISGQPPTASSSQRCSAARLCRPVCQAQATSQASAAPAGGLAVQNNKLLFGAVEALFKFPPFFNMAVKNARKRIAERGRDIGIDMAVELASLRGVDWGAQIAKVRDPNLEMPEYYTLPFHAYPEGHLSLAAALRADVDGRSVHAPVMDPEGKEMRADGDEQLRSSYTQRMQELMAQAGRCRPMADILDIGCATGLSSLELQRGFPGARIQGIDLSPQHLAVATYQQERRHETGTDAGENITFSHAAAEATGFADESFDLVSSCLVMHELPQFATKAIMKEAFRLLRPGGVMAIMEMNPKSAPFERMWQNPFAYAAFKSTEPWLMDYISLDLHGALREAGFTWVRQAEATPRHRTVVAVKPQ
ncbi:hypothetical protein WJX72_009428 [[Myrmecia] bisecta]|uniref:Methyltransferase domain-containing protein n=1 Tax=[Myrmecia] bisecta TaxID=41462 RepID=A0AAW1R8T5_9CHLO